MSNNTQVKEIYAEVDVKDVVADREYVLPISGDTVYGEDLIADGVEGFVYEVTYEVVR